MNTSWKLVPVLALLLAAPLARGAEENPVRSLTASRDSLTKQLNDRIAADAAKEAPLDVVLDRDEALMAYGYHQVRPPLTRAPQFNDNAGKSMDRIHGGRMEFAPGREDVRLTFHRRGGQWIGPEIGMISTKIGEQFHLRRSDATGLVAGKDGVSGRFGFTAAAAARCSSATRSRTRPSGSSSTRAAGPGPSGSRPSTTSASAPPSSTSSCSRSSASPSASRRRTVIPSTSSSPSKAIDCGSWQVRPVPAHAALLHDTIERHPLAPPAGARAASNEEVP